LSRYEDAINTYNKALAIQPTNLTILFDKANLLPYLGKYEDAINVYDTILTLNPHSSNAMGRKGLNLYDLGRSHFLF
jgi:tetratricopeptide (TPR) repeat protein